MDLFFISAKLLFNLPKKDVWETLKSKRKELY